MAWDTRGARRFGVGFMVGWIIAIAAPAHAQHSNRASPNVPVGHWAYRYVDKLVGFGLVRSDTKGTLPWTRAEFARLLTEAVLASDGGGPTLNPGYRPYLDRLLREFGDEFAAYDDAIPGGFDTYFKPVDSLRVRVAAGNLKPRVAAVTGSRAVEGTPLYHNQDGFLVVENWSTLADLTVIGRLWGPIAFEATPIFAWRDDSNSVGVAALDDPLDVDLLRGAIKLQALGTEWEFRRDTLWWGPARRSSLILSNHSPAFDMVKLSNPEPYLLPGIGRYLGLIKFVFFVGRLNEQRVRASTRPFVTLHPLLIGTRLSLKPLPWFELGLTRTIVARTRLENGKRLSAGDWFKVFAGQNIGGAADTSNQLAGIDGLVRLPFLRNTELYAQMIGEDEAGGLPTDRSYIFGAYIPRLTADGALDLRLETTFTVAQYSVSSSFIDGYTHDRLSIGSPVGPDAFELWGRATYDPRPDVTVGVEAAYWTRGSGRSTTPNAQDEKSYSFKADLGWWVTDYLELRLEGGYERISNFNFAKGAGQSNGFVLGEARLDF
ncbi:MAG: hypothetical protein KC466_04450 [Myxococcales bacterium]|nr:hypothetical protein [Myxococcales bacterium]